MNPSSSLSPTSPSPSSLPELHAIVIGGGAAGLAAATYIARAKRNVLILDRGEPRNRFARHSHGVLGQDGIPGPVLLANARKQLAAYPTTRFESTGAASARKIPGGFEITTDDGRVFQSQRLLLATGLTDELPEIPGLRERWGETILHCPYCHGYEIPPGPIGILYAGPMSAHLASLLPDWGPTTLLGTGDSSAGEPLQDEPLALLARRGVRVEPRRVREIRGNAPEIEAVILEDGTELEMRAIFAKPHFRLNAQPLIDQLGIELEETPMGKFIKVDPMTKVTSVPGVYSAGDTAQMGHSIMLASAAGMMAGVSLHQSLMHPIA